MWESPINIYETISNMVEKEIDGNIIVEIKKQLGIDINKDELIKALQYDRNQYDKGYQDGLNADRWISVYDELPDEQINEITQDFEYVLCATTFGDVRPYKYGKPIGHEKAHFWNGPGIMDEYVTHWMPWPAKPYMAESEVQE